MPFFSYQKGMSSSSERKSLRKVLIVKAASAGRMVSPRIFIFIVTDVSQCIGKVSFTIVFRLSW